MQASLLLNVITTLNIKYELWYNGVIFNFTLSKWLYLNERLNLKNEIHYQFINANAYYLNFAQTRSYFDSSHTCWRLPGSIRICSSLPNSFQTNERSDVVSSYPDSGDKYWNTPFGLNKLFDRNFSKREMVSIFLTFISWMHQLSQ